MKYMLNITGNKMTKKVAISGYYGFENFGDEAILRVLANRLKTEGFSVTVFSKNPKKTSEKLGVKTVYTFALKDVIKTIKNSDVLVSGGGSLLQDATSLKSLFYYLFVIATALAFRKKVVIFAQGIGPINNDFGKNITKGLLKHCKYITVRDEKSLKLLESWDIKADLVSDPVWDIQLPLYNPTDKVGVQLRSWKALSSEYLFELANKINEYFSDKEVNIYSFQDSLDLDICKEFENNLKTINPSIRTRVVPALSIDETIKEFSELSYLIGMRYHACLLALKFGIPTFALSYDEKVEKIAKRFSLPCSYLDDEENFNQFFESLICLKDIEQKTKECKFDFTKVLEKIESD